MKVLVYILLLMSCNGIAQQDAIYSQYMFNPFAINPAYAGSRNAANVVLINRNQWVGLDGAPNTQTLSAHVPTNKKSLAWGLNLSHDKLGPTRNLFAAATGAYHLKLETGTLSFGLRGGIYNSAIDHGELNFREENDVLDHKQRQSSMVPTFDFGLYYFSERFFTGLSITHLTKHRFQYDAIANNQEYFLRRHFFLSSGYVFELKQNIIVKPTILLKYAGASSFSIDGNVNVLFNELFWLGIGLRDFSSVNFLVDFNVTDYLRVGYSYGMTINKLNTYSHGSHEILVGFDFNLKKSEVISPRFL